MEWYWRVGWASASGRYLIHISFIVVGFSKCVLSFAEMAETRRQADDFRLLPRRPGALWEIPPLRQSARLPLADRQRLRIAANQSWLQLGRRSRPDETFHRHFGEGDGLVQDAERRFHQGKVHLISLNWKWKYLNVCGICEGIFRGGFRRHCRRLVSQSGALLGRRSSLGIVRCSKMNHPWRYR